MLQRVASNGVALPSVCPLCRLRQSSQHGLHVAARRYAATSVESGRSQPATPQSASNTASRPVIRARDHHVVPHQKSPSKSLIRKFKIRELPPDAQLILPNDSLQQEISPGISSKAHTAQDSLDRISEHLVQGSQTRDTSAFRQRSRTMVSDDAKPQSVHMTVRRSFHALSESRSSIDSVKHVSAEMSKMPVPSKKPPPFTKAKGTSNHAKSMKTMPAKATSNDQTEVKAAKKPKRAKTTKPVARAAGRIEAADRTKPKVKNARKHRSGVVRRVKATRSSSIAEPPKSETLGPAQEARRSRPAGKRTIDAPLTTPVERIPRRTFEAVPEREATAEVGTVAGRTLKEAMLEEKAIEEAESFTQQIDARTLSLEVIDVDQPPVPRLAHGLDRVLFNPGLYQLRDPRSRVFNFDPYLEKLMPVDEFDFDTIADFRPPSKDPILAQVASERKKKYVSSTSSMTGIMKHFHFLLSGFRSLNFSMLSHDFSVQSNGFTKLSHVPAVIFLRHREDNYAVDADKEFDGPNVLSMMGKYMEKLLTLDSETFEHHRIGKSHLLDQDSLKQEESFHYSTAGDFVLRSQLDAYDPRLPGTGMFDLKTRAVLPIRMDTADYKWGMDYELRTIRGDYESYEREYHDMLRSTLLKYSLQVRMGRMDGIFVAYHNIRRIFGFQYISLEDMDIALHGQSDRSLGDQEFLLTLKLINQIFDEATSRFPGTSIRITFDTRPIKPPFMYIFAEAVSEEEVEKIQGTAKARVEEWEQSVKGRKPTDTETAPQQTTSEAEPSSAQELEQLLQEELDAKMFKPGVNSDEAERKEANKDTTVSEPVRTEELPSTSPQPAAEDTVSATTSKQTVWDEEIDSEPTAAEEDEPASNVAAWVLRVQSRVNNAAVSRPKDLKADDKWELHYDLEEITGGKRARSLYDMSMRRRAREYEKLLSKKVTEDDGDTIEEEGFYQVMLRELAERGRQYRATLDERDKAVGELVFKPAAANTP